MDSEDPSLAKEDSQLESETEAAWEAEWEARHEKKWGKMEPTKIWKPFLKSFTLFPNLPIEIRQEIWKLSLQPRVIEVKYNVTHGFYTPVNSPVAVRVNKDSRAAVKSRYPLCFGSIIHEPAIIFNFSLDTLYLDMDLGPEIIPFLFGLNEHEAKNLQYLAIDRYLEDWQDYAEFNSNIDINVALQKSTRSMPALKEVHMVVKLDEFWHDHGFPEGTGPIELWEYMPDNCQMYMHHEAWHLEDEDGESECAELPIMDDFLEPFQAPKKGTVFGRRPMELTLDPYPWIEEGPGNERSVVWG